MAAERTGDTEMERATMAEAFDPSLPGEVAVAASLYEAIESPEAQAVLDWLIDHPDERIEGWDLAERLDLDEHKDVGLSMYEIGRAAAELGRTRPWLEAQLGYLMPIDQAALFRSAREKVLREEAEARG
jgi:hypothetical protein